MREVPRVLARDRPSLRERLLREGAEAQGWRVLDLQIADRAYVLENGEVRKSGTGAELLDDPDVRAAYLSM